jgi:hypothetical protein
MMRPEDRAREMLAESGIPEAGSTRLMESLTALGRSVDEVVPLPGPELTALMTSAAGPSRRRRARLMVATAVALGTVGAGGFAAAANELPDGAQNIVAAFSERYLPFDLPRAGAPGPDPESRFVPVSQTPRASQGAERADGPAPSPAGEPAGVGSSDDRAGDEAASTTESKLPPRSPSPTDPGQRQPTPAPAPADEAPLAGQGGQVEKPGGVPGPEAGEEPVAEPQTGEVGVGEEPPVEVSPGAEASPDAEAEAVTDALPGKAAEKSQGGDRRGARGRGKPSGVPAGGGVG